MLPWPKPATWPLIPPDSSAEVMEKEKVIIFQLCFALVSNYASCCMKSQICLLFYLVAPYPSQLIHTNFVFLSVYKFFSFDCYSMLFIALSEPFQHVRLGPLVFISVYFHAHGNSVTSQRTNERKYNCMFDKEGKRIWISGILVTVMSIEQ